MRERERRGFHLRPERPHAAAVVDEQSERDWNVVAAEQRDRLPLAVFVHRERAALEAGHELAAPVPDGGVENDKACFGAEGGLLRACGKQRQQRDNVDGPHGAEGPGARRT